MFTGILHKETFNFIFQIPILLFSIINSTTKRSLEVLLFLSDKTPCLETGQSESTMNFLVPFAVCRKGIGVGPF